MNSEEAGETHVDVDEDVEGAGEGEPPRLVVALVVCCFKGVVRRLDV